MKITNLKQQVKNPERISIFVDNSYSFSLSLNELADLKIKNNQEITEAELKKYKKISDDGKVKDRAFAWLLSRPHSTREFMDYMRRKKVDQELASSLAEFFTTKNYLNDQSFARWFTDLKKRGNKSNRAIRSELMKKGIQGSFIDFELEEQGDDELLRLKELILKKKRIGRYANDELKLIKYLTSQGFSYHIIKQELKSDIPDDF